MQINTIYKALSLVSDSYGWLNNTTHYYNLFSIRKDIQLDINYKNILVMYNCPFNNS